MKLKGVDENILLGELNLSQTDNSNLWVVHSLRLTIEPKLRIFQTIAVPIPMTRHFAKLCKRSEVK